MRTHRCACAPLWTPPAWCASLRWSAWATTCTLRCEASPRCFAPSPCAAACCTKCSRCSRASTCAATCTATLSCKTCCCSGCLGGGVAGSQLPALLQQQLKDLPGYPLLRLCDLGASRLAPLPLAEYCAPAAPVEASEGGGGGGGRGGGAASWDSGKKQSRGMGATSHVCARWYRAPELLCGSMFYGPPSDVWSMALAAAELYTLSASLSQDAVALGLSARRGDAFGDTLPMDGEKMNPILAREEWQKAGWEEGRVCGPLSRRDRCRVTLFHGSCDATQLLSVLNVLGTPNDAQVADMRLPSACRVALEALREAACAAAGEGVAAAAPWPQQALAGLGLGGGGDAAAAAPASLPPLDVAKLLSAKFAIPPDVAGMLSGMLKWAPSARTTAAEALRHEALSGSGVGFPA